jgi:HEAT repeat protein
MNTKIKLGIIALGVCIVGMVVYYFIPKGRVDSNTIALRQTLLQAVAEAKKGNRDILLQIISAIGKGDKRYISEVLLPDYISFLKDSDGQVQWLAATGLYKSKSPKGTKPLFEYLKAKDIRNLAEKAKKGQVDEYQYGCGIYASVNAILALGESGDKSVIPLLESLQGIQELQMEWGPGPVEKALAQLGSFKSLSNIPPRSPGADDTKIMRAASAIREIRDPKMVPQLIATVKDRNCAENIRAAAISALGEIKDVDSLPFILSVVNDPNYPEMVREDAAKEASKAHQPDAEEALLNMAKSSDSEIRIDGLFQLAKLNNEKYMPNIIKIVVDKTVPLEERTELSIRIANRTEPEELKPHVEMLRSGLKAVKEDNSPADEVRVFMWKALNKATGEEPKLELKDDKPAFRWLSWDFSLKFERENVHLSAAELRNKVNDKIKSIIVNWNPENGGEKQ